MRQLLVVGLLVSALAFATPAGAGERPWYLGLEGGVELDGGSSGSSQDDYGWAGLLTVGTGVSTHFSLEAELGYRTTDSYGYLGYGGGVDQTTLMLNAIYEMPLTKEVSFAAGVGVGGDKVSFGGQSDMQIAAQLKLGLNVAISDNAELVTNFRYVEAFRTYVDDCTVTVGIRFAL
jgi:hypothetical protein